MIRGPDILSREANNGAISKILFQNCYKATNQSIAPSGKRRDTKSGIQLLRHTFCVSSIGQMQLTLYVVTVMLCILILNVKLRMFPNINVDMCFFESSVRILL